MSMPPLPDVLQALSIPYGDARPKAEAMIQHMRDNEPATLLLQLLEVLKTCPTKVSRTYAAVFLRQLLERKSPVWATLPPDHQTGVKASLLEVLAKEPEWDIRRNACHTVAELAATVVKAGQEWAGLVECMTAMCAAPDTSLRRLGFVLLRQVLVYVGEAFVAKHFQASMGIIEKGLGDPDHGVQSRALQSGVELFKWSPKEAKETVMRLVPPMLTTLGAILSVDARSAAHAIEAMAELMDARPKYLRPYVSGVVDAMTKVMQHEAFESRIRVAAYEVVMSLCESAPDMMRRHLPTLQGVVTLVASFVCKVVDDPTWVSKVEVFEELPKDTEFGTMVAVGEEAFDRLAKSLGGRTMTPAIISLVKPLIASPEWQNRRGACIIISLVAEGCGMFLLENISEVISLIAPLSEDPHPRVRFMVAHCLGQLAQDLGHLDPEEENFQDLTHTVVVPVLLGLMSEKNAAVPRIRAHAAAAFAYFLHPDACSMEYLPPIRDVLAVAQQLLSLDHVCQLNTLSVVACISSIAGSEFVEFHAPFLAFAVDVMKRATTKELRLLRGKAIECAGFICGCLPHELACAHGAEILKVLIDAMAAGFEDDDPDSFRYMLGAFGRIGEAMGDGFAPYLSAVLPAVLSAAAKDVKSVVTEVDSDEEQDSDDEGHIVNLPGVGRRRIAMDSGALQDKQIACKAMFDFVDNIGMPLLPYLDTIVTSLAPVCHFENSEDARIGSVCCMHHVLNLALTDPADPTHGMRVLSLMIEDVITAMMKEKFFNVLCMQVESFARMMRACSDSGDPATGTPPRAGIDLANLPAVVKAIQTLLGKAFERRTRAAVELANNEDRDEVAIEQFKEAEEAEDELLTSFVDTFAALIRLHGDDALPSFHEQQTLDFMTKCLGMADRPSFKAAAMCFFDDIIEHCPERGLEVLPMFFPVIVEGLSSPTSTIRQPSVYGVGVCSGLHHELISSNVKSLIQGLVASVPLPAEDPDDWEMTADNAVAALVRWVSTRFEDMQKAGVDLNAVLTAIVGALPLTADEIEARMVHEWAVKAMTGSGVLASLPPQAMTSVLANIAAGHCVVLGETEEPLMTDETIKMLAGMLQTLLARPECMAVIGGLDEEQRSMAAGLCEAAGHPLPGAAPGAGGKSRRRRRKGKGKGKGKGKA